MTLSNSQQNASSIARQMLNKVPEITIFFWIIKVLCTTVGETASDFLNVNLNFGLTGTSIVMGICLAVALFFQFKAKKYTPFIYWLTVVLISIFGTLVTDNLTDSMKVPLETSTIIFSILLALTFGVWYAKEKTLSIHSIFTRRREAFYWLAILFTFALGTATGDLMAESLGLGYFTTGVIVCTAIAAFAVAWRLGLDSILAFWIIYIMTRPLGASVGDYLSQPQKYGGLGLGATATSGIFVGAILLTVAFLAVTKWDSVRSAPIDEEVAPKPYRYSALWQVAAVMVVLVGTSVAGYHWRHNALQAQTQSASAITQVPGQKVLTDQTAPLSPLGDLSDFRTITQDTLNLVLAGNLSGAKNRVADLEYEWDNSEARLKPMDPTEWATIDTAIDKVLRQLRAVHQDADGCKSALEGLLKVVG